MRERERDRERERERERERSALQVMSDTHLQVRGSLTLNDRIYTRHCILHNGCWMKNSIQSAVLYLLSFTRPPVVCRTHVLLTLFELVCA